MARTPVRLDRAYWDRWQKAAADLDRALYRKHLDDMIESLSRPTLAQRALRETLDELVDPPNIIRGEN